VELGTEYRCPRCRSRLWSGTVELQCHLCARTYPIFDGIPDFTEDRHVDRFRPGDELPEELREALTDEESGTRARIERFYGPLIERRVFSSTRLPEHWNVLDCGCGNGLAVDLLAQRGYSVWGIDLSELRRWQWRERRHRNRLSLADANRLPFADQFFDVVISSGVLEHVGVIEQRDPRFRVRPTPVQRQERERFLSEILRVSRPGGVIWLDFPNGRFPIDFWHVSGFRASGRPHWPWEKFSPSIREIRRLLRSSGSAARACAISPSGRFVFHRSDRRWYGRLFGGFLRTFYRLVSHRPFRPLAGSALNPYLVVEIRKP
jgi:SAM-dependent methyltransferase